MTDSDNLAATWSRYWDSGQTESSSGELVSLAPIASAWRAFFSRLPNGARLLDLATGGGHVLRLAIDAAAELGRTFDLSGTDLADLSAVAARFPAQVKLTGKADVARLPFADGEFDSVVSQFGIEYADSVRAYPEAVRVLASDGRGQFILHHQQGEIVSAARARLAAYRALFPDDAAFRDAQEVFERIAGGDDRSAIVAAILRFRRTVAALAARLRGAPAWQDLGQIAGLLQNLARQPESHVAEDALRRITSLWDEVKGWQLRQRAVVEAALSREGAERVGAILNRAGAKTIAVEEVRSDSTAIAWCCTFRK